jgi:hypothetical protein
MIQKLLYLPLSKIILGFFNCAYEFSHKFWKITSCHKIEVVSSVQFFYDVDWYFYESLSFFREPARFGVWPTVARGQFEDAIQALLVKNPRPFFFTQAPVQDVLVVYCALKLGVTPGKSIITENLQQIQHRNLQNGSIRLAISSVDSSPHHSFH